MVGDAHMLSEVAQYDAESNTLLIKLLKPPCGVLLFFWIALMSLLTMVSKAI